MLVVVNVGLGRCFPSGHLNPQSKGLLEFGCLLRRVCISMQFDCPVSWTSKLCCFQMQVQGEAQAAQTIYGSFGKLGTLFVGVLIQSPTLQGLFEGPVSFTKGGAPYNRTLHYPLIGLVKPFLSQGCPTKLTLGRCLASLVGALSPKPDASNRL